MEAFGQEHGHGQDPQRLLAQLASEYERSRRFLEQLENSFAREPPPPQPAGPTYTPAWAEGSLEQPEPPAAPEPLPPTTGAKQSPESVPSKLRAKLRSFFSRRNAQRDELTQEMGAQPVIRAASESQSTIAVSGGGDGGNFTSPVSERPSIAGGGPPPSARRTHQMYYTTNSAEMPRVPRSARDADTRPNTATRRSSVVNFGGDATDLASQGWVARVAGGGTGGGDAPADRPATGRRSSILQYGASGPMDTAVAAIDPNSFRGIRRTADSGTPGAVERPLTARRAAVVQLNEAAAALRCSPATSSGQQPSVDPSDRTISGYGDSAAAAAAATVTATKRGVPSVHFAGGGGGTGSSSGGGGGGGGGVLHDVCNPYEFMAVMAGPRRSTSFQYRSGAALQPTAQRLRSSATVTRRASIEVCAQQVPQHQPQQPAQPPPSPQPQQFQRGGGRGSLEGRQIWLTTSTTSIEQSPASGRRAGSLEIPRPYSAAAARNQHPAAVATGITAPLNISSSALFASVSLSGST
ncbi:hypothetical protein Vretifemale_13686, partial [Volvox reticuliferus]